LIFSDPTTADFSDERIDALLVALNEQMVAEQRRGVELMAADKIAAAIERLTAEKQKRIDQKIERGEAIHVPLIVAVTGAEEANAGVEAAMAQRLAELREAGERREVVRDQTLILTGAPRGKWEASAESPVPADLPELPAEEPAKLGRHRRTIRAASSRRASTR
jgi:hypothetical protein